MVKKIFIIISLSFVYTSSAVETVNLKLINLSDKEFSTKEDAQIYTLVGNKNNLELKGKRIAKPSNKSLQLLKLVTPRDKYAIKVLDANGKDIMFIGIGNPFYIYADHIGYEDKNVHGGFIETEFELPISLNISASQIILLSQSEFGFKEIKRLDIN